MTDAKLEALLYPVTARGGAAPRPVPNWAEARQQLATHRSLTLFQLWTEYIEANPTGYQYSHFCKFYRGWRGAQVDLVMRLTHKAGERLFVDYSGKRFCEMTAPILFRSSSFSSNLYTHAQRCLSGLDAHMHTCVLAATDSSGYQISVKEFSTSEAAQIHHVVEICARNKYLAVEESFLAGWIANTLRPYVDELIVCGPWNNALISRSGNRDDVTDAYKLCRL